MLVGFGALVGRKPEVQVKAYGLRILLVCGDLENAVGVYAVREQPFADACAACVWGNKQHFEAIGGCAHEGNECVVVHGNGQVLHRRQGLRHVLFDVLYFHFLQKGVRGADGLLPNVD